MAPDSVTIYEMEIPYNTTIYKQMKAEGKNWSRRWRIGKPTPLGRLRVSRTGKSRLPGRQRLHGGERPFKTKFLYRDRLWAGADLLSLGVASFGHIGGVHYQNHHDFDVYVSRISPGTCRFTAR